MKKTILTAILIALASHLFAQKVECKDGVSCLIYKQHNCCPKILARKTGKVIDSIDVVIVHGKHKVSWNYKNKSILILEKTTEGIFFQTFEDGVYGWNKVDNVHISYYDQARQKFLPEEEISIDDFRKKYPTIKI